MKVLVVEDDPKIAGLLRRGLTEEGFVVDVCHNGRDGLENALIGQYDVMLLDISLPNIDGWTVLRELENSGSKTPVLVLSGHDEVRDRVHGLTLGADDYLTKPFAWSEVLARVKALVRRKGSAAMADTLVFEDLHLDVRRCKAFRNGVEVNLTTKEFQLLELLLRHQEEVLTRTVIAERVWDLNFDGDSNVVDVTVRRLRAKIDDPYPRKLVHTVRGRGYVLR